MELRGSCNGCGACCRVIVLEQSPEEVRQMAALTRVLGIPSDHSFAAAHWQPITRAEAMRQNPFYTSRLPPDAHLYTCDRLAADGRCTAYEERPLVCRGYPWYDQPPRPMPLADEHCGYAVDLPPPPGGSERDPGRAETIAVSGNKRTSASTPKWSLGKTPARGVSRTTRARSIQP